MKKILLLLLCCATLLPLLVACGNGGKETQDSTEGVTEAPVTNTQVFLVESLQDYTIIYPDGKISLDLIKQIRAVQATVEEKFGVKISSKSDASTTVTNPAREILIGKTNRTDADAVFEASAPRVDDYAIVSYGEKILIAGWSEEKISLALDAFEESITSLASDSPVFFNNSMMFSVRGQYEMENLSLDGTNINEYTIVYEDSDAGYSLAQTLQESIKSRCGYALTLCKSSHAAEDGRKILIGDTSFALPADVADPYAADQYYVGMSNGNLYLYGVDTPALYKATKTLIDSVESATGTVGILSPETGLVISADTSLTAMTFNVLCDYDPANRAPYVLDLIRKYDPDTLGMQEVSSTWVKIFDEELTDEYAKVGIGREANGSGEQVCIFYKKDKFTLIESGTKWMSDTPDVVSKYADSEYHRIFTYALLERKSDGTRFMHINTHPEHGEEVVKAEVRLKQFKVLAAFINEHKDIPVFVSGDLNCQITSKELQSLISATDLESSAQTAVVAQNASTFREVTIDFILFSQGDFTVYDYTVDTTKYGERRIPSDHCPIIVRYDIGQ